MKNNFIFSMIIISALIGTMGFVSAEDQPTNVTVDNTSPVVSITFPANNTNTTNINLEISYTVSDDNLESCWWTRDGGENNSSIICGDDIVGETWEEGKNCMFGPPFTCYPKNHIVVYANDSVGNIGSSDVYFLLDATPPVSTITMRLGNEEDWNTADSYSNGTWTTNNVTVSITSVDSGVGFQMDGNCNLNNFFPKYCIDTTNTCIPDTSICFLATVSSMGISYIRYQTIDFLGNAETIQSRTIMIYEPDLTLTPSPIPLDFGILGIGMSSEREVTLTPGTTDLDVSVNIMGDDIMQSIQTDRTGGWTNLKGDSFVALASTPMSFNAKLTIPEETESNTYSGTIVYTILEHI